MTTETAYQMGVSCTGQIAEPRNVLEEENRQMMKSHVLDIVCQRMMTSHARCVKAARCVVGMMIRRIYEEKKAEEL